VCNPRSVPLSLYPYPTSTQPNTLPKIMDYIDAVKKELFENLFVVIISVIISVIFIMFLKLMSLAVGLIVDVFYIVYSVLKTHLPASWDYRVPLPLLLSAIAATCGLTLAGQWYYSPLAYTCPEFWYERALDFLGGR
jgi:hypothetical protein